MKPITRVFLCAMVLGAGAAAALGGSIWEKASAKARAIHSDDTARRRGDSITVVVVERSTIANDTKRKLEKKDERTADMSGTFDPAKLFAKPVGTNVFSFPILDYTSSGETKFDGKSNYGAARYYYRAIIKDYPLSSYARRAQQRLDEIRGEPDNPPNRFQWLTDLFPSEED